MRVPMADLGALYAPLAPELEAATRRVVASGRFVLGPELEHFEARIAARVGVPRAVGVSSGTDALLLALSALDVGPGDVVATTPYSFVSTAAVVRRLGAELAFVDVDPDTLCLDPAALSAWARAHPARAARLKVVLPVHLFGQCADTVALGALARDLGAHLVEDAAQALDATTVDGQAAGAAGALGCFSLFPTKNLGALGDGGFVTASDLGLGARVASLRSHGTTDRAVHAELGGNHRLDELQAAFLDVLLPHLDAWTARRRANAAAYDAAFADLAIAPLPRPSGLDAHACHQYVVRAPAGGRDALAEHLGARGVSTAVYYPVPLHLQPLFADLRHRPGDFPVAEAAARDTLALPVHPALTEAQRAWVLEAVTSWPGARRPRALGAS